MIFSPSHLTVDSEAISFRSKLTEAFATLKSYITQTPDVGIVLGSGLGNLTSKFKDSISIPFEVIPYFPISKVKGHKGQFVYGEFQGKIILAMQGRVHYYEGYSMQAVTFGIRLLQKLGVENLIITNASGGMREFHKPGSLFFIKDHINLMGDNPLRGENLDEFGVRFPDMSKPYDPHLLNLGKKAAAQLNIEIHSGVYVAVSGPNYETPAEIDFLRRIGGDVVGMSTVPEVIVAVHGRMKVLGISCITDVPVLDLEEEITHDLVIQNAQKAEKDFIRLISKIVEGL